MTSVLSQAATLPNVITLIRIVLIPIFVIAVLNQRYEYAFAFFVAAALSDMFDGMIARRLNQSTRLGAFLDAFADKALLIAAFVVCSVYGWISMWLTICVLSRDLVITLGWIVLTIMSRPSKVGTIMSGKIAIASQLILISYIMLALNVSELPDSAPFFAELIVAALAVFSGVQYVRRALSSDGE